MMVFTLASVFSLSIMISSLLFAIASKRICLPLWYESIIWIFILSAVGLLLNSLFNPPYIENYQAEIILRVFGALLVAGGVAYAYMKSGARK